MVANPSSSGHVSRCSLGLRNRMNQTELQAAVSATADGGTLTLPAGLHTIDASVGTVTFTRSITIDGGGSIIACTPVPGNGTPMLNGDTPNGSIVTLKNFTLAGPAITYDPTNGSETKANDSWIGIRVGRTGCPTTRVTLRNVNITGLFGSGFMRVGGGYTSVIGCIINAWETPVAIFAGHPSDVSGFCRLICNKLSGVGSKSSSVGVYIHPNMSLVSVGNVFEDFNYHGLSAHGGPEPVAGQHWYSGHDRFNRCPMIHSPRVPVPVTVDNAVCSGPPARASVIKGNLAMTDSTLVNQSLTYFPDYDHTVTIVDTTWAPTAVCGGAQGSGSWLYRNVEWQLGGVGSTPSVEPDVVGTVTYEDCDAYDVGSTSPYLIKCAGNAVIDATELRIHTSRNDAVLSTATNLTGPTIVS